MKAILLVNLGSPDSTSVSDVRKYLRQFLMDQYVIDSSWLVRKFVVEGIILPFRPKQSAEAYRSIWWEEGSPLIVISKRFHEAFQKETNVPVALAMRYGKPSLEQGVEELVSKGATDILVVPMYPQYAMSTITTTTEKIKQIIAKNYPTVQFNTLAPWYNNPDYIQLLANSMKETVANNDHVLFSFHGIPHSHIYKTDITQKHCKIDGTCCNPSDDATAKLAHSVCYRHQCMVTAHETAKVLGLNSTQYSISFQSRLGDKPWLLPATDKVLEDYGQRGIKKLAIVCPAFVSDCLETLEEIAIEGKEQFIEAGGEQLDYIPCLNDNPEWVRLVAKWCNDKISE